MQNSRSVFVGVTAYTEEPEIRVREQTKDYLF